MAKARKRIGPIFELVNCDGKVIGPLDGRKITIEHLVKMGMKKIDFVPRDAPKSADPRVFELVDVPNKLKDPFVRKKVKHEKG